MPPNEIKEIMNLIIIANVMVEVKCSTWNSGNRDDSRDLAQEKMLPFNI